MHSCIPPMHFCRKHVSLNIVAFIIMYVFGIVMMHTLLSAVIPLHLGEQYSLFIFLLERNKMFIFDPNLFPLWSQNVQFKRWMVKFRCYIFPKYRNAMSKLSEKYVKDFWSWDTVVMDNEWEKRYRYQFSESFISDPYI